LANLSITMEGIHQAVTGLGYKENSKKYKVITAINAYYTSEQSLIDVASIDTDTLIKDIWNLEETPSKIRTKRRNFSSLKSSINADLKKSSDKGKNPENIILTDVNTFDMSEEAKANLLNSFSDALRTGDVDIGQATSILSAITDFLDTLDTDAKDDQSINLVNQIKNILDKLSDNIITDDSSVDDIGKNKQIQPGNGFGSKDGDATGTDGGSEEGVDGSEGIEEIEEIDDYDEDTEEIELDDDEEIEEIDDLDDIEEVDDTDVETIENDDIDAEDIEEVELDEDEDSEEFDELDSIDDDVEELELDDDEELEEIDDYGENIEEIDLDEDEEIEEIDDLDDIEEVDDTDVETIEDDDIDAEDIEKVELDEDEDSEEFDELDSIDDDVEELELDDDEELEEIDDYGEDIEEIDLDEDEEIEEIDDLDDIEDVDDTDVETIEDDDIEEVELDEDEDLEEFDELDSIDDDVEELELDDDEELEEIDDYGEDTEEIELDDDEELQQVDGLTEEELKALEEFKEKKKAAEQFDDKLSQADKNYNKYVIVPEGEYTIGTKKTLKSSLELQKFDMPKVYIGKFPITNALFESFIEETGYITTAEKNGFGNVFFGKFRKKGNTSVWKKNSGSTIVKKAFWYQPEGPDSSIHGKKYHPVVQISVTDAFAFASWIGRRLPTETEWEAAARTDLGYKYPWGNTWKDNACNVEKTGAGDTTAVDFYTDHDNEFKISDLLGNIMEWTSDIEDAPIKTKRKQKFNIAKGGSWNSQESITISSRALFKPNYTSNTIGFRCISEIFQ
jgi:formylglycine-generating enzyme required for sulfatase activity